MHARLIAFLILIALIIIPIGAYYFFTQTHISSISVSTDSGSIFSLHLEGSFGIDGLPLADKALVYSRSCTTSCEISPILPANYILTLMSSGKITTVDTISIQSGDKLLKSYRLIDDIIFSAVNNPELMNISSGSTWHTRTTTGSWVSDGENQIEDIRFTDAIDLSPNIRLGYIDKNDTKKLSIGNFTLGQSVLVRLDRTTGENVVVRKGMDIASFLFYRNAPAYMNPMGDIYTITY